MYDKNQSSGTGGHSCILASKRDHATTIKHMPTEIHGNPKRNEVSNVGNTPFFNKNQSSGTGGHSRVSAFKRDHATTIEYIPTRFYRNLKRNEVSSVGNTPFLPQKPVKRNGWSLMHIGI